LEGRLVLVTAPAGWGKTSALAEWASKSDIPVAWVTCEMDEAGPASLIRAIVTAIDRVSEGFSADLGSMLRSARPLPTGQLMEMLAEAVAEEAPSIALVLDDFHHVQDQDVLSGLFALATSGISNLRVVIAGCVRTGR
jgi:LuxR family maltose regulon positive regulatory protein